MRRVFIFCLVLIVLIVGGVTYDVIRFFHTPLGNDAPRILEIKPGDSFRGLTHQLYQDHVIGTRRGEYYLDIYARLTGQSTRIKSGEYQLQPHQNPEQLVALLVSGKVFLRRLTLVEGWRFSQIMKAVEHDPYLKHTLKGKTDAEIMAALGHPKQKAEGRFMPDTYFFPRGTTDVAFLKRSYRAMQKFLDKAWANRADGLAVDSKYQALIMASIIEKETAVPSERARVSGVFNRRLKKGMKLQTDASVIYGIPNFDGKIHLSDLRRDTPYNTYTRYGLPPTPIASPSRASIRAALHPKHGKALYFVAKGDGTHVFSDTLAEQNAAVRKYQLGK